MNGKVWLLISLLLALVFYWQYEPAKPKATARTQTATPDKNAAETSTLWADNFSLLAQANAPLASNEPKTKLAPLADTDAQLAANEKQTTSSTIKSCPFAQFTDEEHQLLDTQLSAFLSETVNDVDTEQRKLGYIFSASSAVTNHHKRLFFSDYLANTPSDAIAAHQLLKVCLQLPHDEGCGQQLDTIVAQADAENGYLWLQLATNKLIQRQPQAFLEYLEIAASKSRFDNYFFRYVDLFLSASVGRIDIAYTKLRNTGDELASAQANNLSYLIDFCTANIEQYQDNCLSLAKSLDGNSTNVDLQTFGSGLLKEMYRKLGDNDALAAQTEIDQLRYSQLYNQDWVNAQSLLQYDQELMFTWLENGKLFGEQAAVNALLAEAKLKSLNPDYQPCPLVE
ncbi:hypothetical protein DXX93_15260 [Thalassotalea euphylliae]|uniref:Uncharacterized protein n=1 Tax=Thalassotalea euphylliae TaxID=1655234 RepID=A0A3E0TTQ8_9GAMM|nr:hypothetical protein [Thalassotalea euphylliae]REL27783.1 hypothetical protein DXX93_15260 [Thalassotalea euphylliae]